MDPFYFNNLFEMFLNDILGRTPLEMIFLILFKYYGWLLFGIIIVRYYIWEEYKQYIAYRWTKQNVRYMFLAIDVPKRNEQSIQAMENLFDHLQGAHGTFTWWAKYIVGEYQLGFSCELVSIEGNIQFIIRTPVQFRNLVEAAVYAQFPDAEITEVQDYTGTVPKDYPSETHDLWGCEFTLSGNPYLPIKTYDQFEHRFSEVFVDPMAALLETMSAIGPGEQIWIQTLIKPLPYDWGIKGGTKEINKILKIPEQVKKSKMGELYGEVAAPFKALASEFAKQTIGLGAGETAGEEKKEEKPQMLQYLPPGEKEKVEGFQRKISKWAFDTKVRFIYVAKKEKMNKAIGVNGTIGAIKQWTNNYTNGFKPALKETGTSSPQYILIDYRRNRRKNIIMKAYKDRDFIIGMPAKPMTGMELASFWHFPSMYIKAPLLKTTEFTKAAAPVGLPLGKEPGKPQPLGKEISEPLEEHRAEPDFDYDSDDFEMQFAKDKKAFEESRNLRAEQLKKVEEEEKQNLEKQAKQKLSQDKRKAKQEEKNEEEQLENLPFID